MLPRNSPVITLIYLLMSLYTSNIISILSLHVPSFKADAKVISVRWNWWNLFFQMSCQSRFVGFLFVPLQLAKERDSILIDVLALHCMHKKHLICFYKNLPLSGFHSTAHLYITERFNLWLRYPISEYQGWLFCICSVFPKWPVDIFSFCLGMYEVISNIFRCSRGIEEID